MSIAYNQATRARYVLTVLRNSLTFPIRKKTGKCLFPKTTSATDRVFADVFTQGLNLDRWPDQRQEPCLMHVIRDFPEVPVGL